MTEKRNEDKDDRKVEENEKTRKERVKELKLQSKTEKDMKMIPA